MKKLQFNPQLSMRAGRGGIGLKILNPPPHLIVRD